MDLQNIVVATKGKIKTNGTIYGRIILLTPNLNKEDFYEISEEEYEEILRQEAQRNGNFKD